MTNRKKTDRMYYSKMITAAFDYTRNLAKKLWAIDSVWLVVAFSVSALTVLIIVDYNEFIGGAILFFFMVGVALGAICELWISGIYWLLKEISDRPRRDCDTSFLHKLKTLIFEGRVLVTEKFVIPYEYDGARFDGRPEFDLEASQLFKSIEWAVRPYTDHGDLRIVPKFAMKQHVDHCSVTLEFSQTMVHWSKSRYSAKGITAKMDRRETMMRVIAGYKWFLESPQKEFH